MPEKQNDQQPEAIDLMNLLGRFWKVLLRLWPGVLILALLLGGVQYYRARRAYVPMYESKAVFTVSSGYSAGDIFTSTYYDNAAAEQLAEAFPYMLSTSMMRELMMQQLGTSYINGTITATNVESTNMFTLSVRSRSPQDAQKILWAVIDCYPQVAVFMVENPQVIIRQEPTLPTAPYNSFSGRGSFAKGAVVGGAAGLALLFVIAFLAKTVSNVDQLKKLVNLPVLAVFPQIRQKKRRSEANTHIMVTRNDALREPLHGLNLKVEKLLETDKKVILVTSTLGGEGKTTVAANLALSLATGGKRVALIDADLRSQSVAERFGGKESPVALLGCLKKQGNALENLVATENENLWYLSGASARDLHYAIDQRAMRSVLSELKEQFDYVVMDTAPCAMVSDTALLCHFADCVLYVVKPDCARQSQILDAINELYGRDVPVAGFIFNNVPVNHSHYGYGYKYGYGYGYGYKYGYGYGKKNKHRS